MPYCDVLCTRSQKLFALVFHQMFIRFALQAQRYHTVRARVFEFKLRPLSTKKM